MKKKPLKIITLVSASFIATSCSLFSNLTYDWMTATNNNTEIRYCLLIGQNEHSDSIERTRWTREALHTRDEKTEINGNANLGVPKMGEITLGTDELDPGGKVDEKTFKVTEVEHMEQKSLAGVVWDEITANNTTATWINKHGKKMTMLISNNDGMAEGAMHAYNYIKGLPLFGYDANTSAMKLVKQCKDTGVGIMGTVDQVAAAQTSAAYMIIRNILDDQNDPSHPHDIGTTKYKPTNRGFNADNPNEYGLYIDGYNTKERHSGIVDPEGPESRSKNNLDLSKTDGYHEILSTSEAIGIKSTQTVSDVGNFLNDKGEVKGADELAWDKDLGYVHKTDSYTKPTKTYEVCHVYNNVAETYLQGTMQSYYKQYADDFGIKDVKIDGDGISEQKIFDQVDPYCSKKTFDAFLINMVTTTDGAAFISKLAEHAANKEGKPFSKSGWDKWTDRLNTPLIFWNKQPQTVDGKVDTETMNNKFFKYTYFVGVDAAYGGKKQGDLILSYLEYCYEKSLGIK